jgi:hypothetical protein
MGKRNIAASAAAVSVALLFYGLWPDRRMASRDLACGTLRNERANGICLLLQRELEWSWLGHAIVSPGYRIGFAGIRRAYCRGKIGEQDIPDLETLRRMAGDWRAETAAGFLLDLVRNRNGSGDAGASSIFDPGNPGYILRGGCPAPQPDLPPA